MRFIGSLDMHLMLIRRKDLSEFLHELRTRDRFDSKRADELERSSIYARDVRDVNFPLNFGDRE